jgi:hypothetical protein
MISRNTSSRSARPISRSFGWHAGLAQRGQDGLDLGRVVRLDLHDAPGHARLRRQFDAGSGVSVLKRSMVLARPASSAEVRSSATTRPA